MESWRKKALLAALAFAATPARADYIGDQIDACSAALTPASRAAVITACNAVILMGELPGYIEGPALLDRGNAFALGADFPHALADYGAALDINPKNPAPYAARGLVLLKQKKYQAAWDDFDAAAALDGKNAAALYGRGLAADRLGRDGATDRSKAEALDPGIAATYSGSGLVP